MLQLIQNIAPYAAALISLSSAVYVTVRTSRNQLTEAYFNRMTDAYERFWAAFVDMVCHPCPEHREKLSLCVYHAVLYSSPKVAHGIQLVYDKALVELSKAQPDKKLLDMYAGELMIIFHEDIEGFRRQKRRMTHRHS